MLPTQQTMFSGAADWPFISIIEDNNALRSALVDRLKLEGFCAKGFLDGQDFLNQLPQTTSDLIVSDVQMPHVGGLELLDQLKSLGVTTPVIMMSSSMDRSLAATCLARGAAAFLEKPFEAQTLIDRIDEICHSFTAIDQSLNSTQLIIDLLRSGHEEWLFPTMIPSCQ